MQHFDEKPPKQGIHLSASVLILTAVVTAILSPIFSLPVSAQEGPGHSEGHGTPRTESETGTGQPTDPNCWGEANSGLAQDDFGDPGVGSHASDPVPNNPGRETPRLGVGNQEEGTPGEHGQTVGPQFGQPCEEGPSSQN
jgi:hypothetical protein